jgi:hypothetical protein
MLGIEKLKATISVVFVFAYILTDVAKNKNYLRLIELVNLFSNFNQIAADAREAWKEAGDITADESFSLAEFVKEKFDIENDALEVKIEKLIDVLPQVHQYYLDAVRLYYAFEEAILSPSTSIRTKIISVVTLLTGVTTYVFDVIDLGKQVVAIVGDLFDKAPEANFRVVHLKKELKKAA